MQRKYKILKEKHVYTSELKLKHCGHGEWVEEPDIIEIEYFTYKALIRRVFSSEPFAKREAYFGGHLCGYVKIPQNHPYYRKEDIDLNCHGGITFNQTNEEHWVGFDCGHSEDKIPTTDYLYKADPDFISLRKCMPIPEGCENHPLFNPTYRNVGYCIEECLNMIDELINIEKAEALRSTTNFLPKSTNLVFEGNKSDGNR